MTILSSDATDFAALSLVDLLQARDMFHVHLMNKANVIGTAVGRYLIRKSDPYPTKSSSESAAAGKSPKAAPKGPKVLSDTEVRYYSWPCVLVLVDKWLTPEDFRTKKYGTEEFVPPTIYLPDGRSVPVCVVLAPLTEPVSVSPGDMSFPSNLIGGGYPVVAHVQGETHIASIGCMVTDGHKAYALTNRHVAGDAGETVYAIVDGHEIPIGKSSEKQLTRLGFQEIYCDWPGREVYLHLDIGLIEVSDKTQWTAQVYGIGEIGPIIDLSVRNISLKLISARVRAYGCASRQMFGQISALFYRYKAIGGFEYIADFLIGPRCQDDSVRQLDGKEVPADKVPFVTGPGDSGTLWLLDQDPTSSQEAGEGEPAARPQYRPIAIQWGGQVFSSNQQNQAYALATCLSTVCNRLNIDLVRDWNTGLPEYWGAVGHYTIAAKAIDSLSSGKLKELLYANRTNITYDDKSINIREFKGLKAKQFIPLADVPDYAWKRTTGRGAEGPNHFADMDKKDADGETLLSICKDKAANVDVQVWLDYYKRVGDKSKGLLPFRVWQFFNCMVEFAKAGKVDEFVCSAGAMAHYVGDACQPLHISYLHHGDPENLGKDGKPVAEGVHDAYEAKMVNKYTLQLLAKVDGTAAGLSEFDAVETGHDAAVRVVQLMQETFDVISPMEIVKEYTNIVDDSAAEIADALWEKFGTRTITIMSNGAKLLAFLWKEAWRVGGAENKISATGAIDEEALTKLYKNPDFMRSYTLGQIGPVLKRPGGCMESAAAGASDGDDSTSAGENGSDRKPAKGHKHATKRVAKTPQSRRKRK
jgi:hypothetical protein